MTTPATPSAPGGGAVYVPPGHSLTPEQVTWARGRPPWARRPVPTLGAAVGVRMAPYGPVLRAVVIGVPSLTDPGDNPDLLVWRVVTDEARAAVRGDGPGGYRWELVDDPWPTLRLRVEPPDGGKGPRIFNETREERLSPLGGWLPPDQVTE